MYSNIKNDLQKEIDEIKEAGLFKEERIIASKQDAVIKLSDGSEVLNFCANNYLGLANHPKVVEGARKALDKWGYGLSSVRFICGTQEVHKELEDRISEFLGKEDTILYVACLDANAGLFEPILGKEDAIISDRLNHASIIDGVRLCKAQRYIFQHNDIEGLEKVLKEAQGARRKIIATDGVFSMDGDIAKLDKICDLAEKYESMVMVDDSHATGFVGDTGRGTPEYHGVMDRVDLITSTLGKALGGANGGFTSGRAELIELFRQRSRPYLFSNTLAPSVCGAAISVLDLLSETTELRDKLMANTEMFRSGMTSAGFDIVKGEHPIVPIMLYDAKLSQEMSKKLLEKGIYVIGFFYPVVPKGEARIRVQLSAAHDKEHVERAIEAFTEIGKELDVI
jgi:glycine C-acetyltransferase